MKHFCIILLTLLTACLARAATINVGCNYTEITNALLTTAQEGDTVLIGAGDCTISNAIYVNRDISFTIAGVGTNLTTLRSAVGLERILHIQSTSATNVFTIRDLNIVSDPANGFGIVVSGSSFRAPFHIYNIQITNVCGRGISMGGTAFGCVDHCYMVAGVGFQQMVDFNGTAEAAWTNAIPFGTTNVQCVEDCYFKTTVSLGGAGNGCFDAYDGAQFVFRHNTQDGTMATGTHGYDSGNCSPRSWEIYNNVFTNTTEQWAAFGMRGGSGVAFSNVAYGAALTVVNAGYYRSCPLNHNYIAGNPTNGEYVIYLSRGQPGQPYYVYFTGGTLTYSITAQATIFETNYISSTNGLVPGSMMWLTHGGNSYNAKLLSFSQSASGTNIVLAQGGFGVTSSPGDPIYQLYTPDGNAAYKYFSGQPVDGQAIGIGVTRYQFTTNFANLPYGSGNANGFGGGGVMIGATLAQTISNLYQAINLVPAGAGIAYSNSYDVPYLIGHDFIATGLTPTNITLINALDNYTNTYGYPAYQQSGTIKSLFPITGTNFHQVFTMWPCYAWSNTVNGVDTEILLPADLCNDYSTNIFKLNRDYFNAVPSGATYTPLVYPHPLVSGAVMLNARTMNVGTLHVGP